MWQKWNQKYLSSAGQKHIIMEYASLQKYKEKYASKIVAISRTYIW